MKTREEIVEKIFKKRKELEELDKKLQVFDYNDMFNKQNAYINKYYKETQQHHKEYNRCFYVYGLNEKNCQLQTLEISYWGENKKTHFDIQYYSHFNPSSEDNYEKIVEITKEEFEKHYDEVKNRINDIITF